MHVALGGHYVRRFADINDGLTFQFCYGSSNYIAIKANMGGRRGAVILTPDMGNVPEHIDGGDIADYPLFILDSLRIVPSVFRDDMYFRAESHSKPGEIHIVDRRILLCCSYPQDGSSMFVDLSSGSLLKTVNSVPIVVTHWGLAIETVTLFTYPQMSAEEDQKGFHLTA